MTKISQRWPECVNLLVPFSRNYAGEMHASEMARQLQLPQKTVARKLDTLREKHLLNYKRVGKNKLFYLDLKRGASLSLLQIIESYKEIGFSLCYPQLYIFLEELSFVCPVILFGSYAKGRAKEDSDVDVVLLARKSKGIDSVLKKYPFKVQAHYVSFALFKKQLYSGHSLAKEIAKDHVFFGEKEKVIKLLIDYYRR